MLRENISAVEAPTAQYPHNINKLPVPSSWPFLHEPQLPNDILDQTHTPGGEGPKEKTGQSIKHQKYFFGGLLRRRCLQRRCVSP
jgi:hypothetical protein